MTKIFITGGTGYIGKRLIKALLQDGHYEIKALIRKESAHKLPHGCEAVYGNALEATSYQDKIPDRAVFIHLVGVPHPSPRKKEEFREIDGVSVREAAIAAVQAHVRHFVYVSVSQYPSHLMKDYQLVRSMGEKLVKGTGIPCSIIRPWYVLGPGHWWPIILLPLYRLASLFPATREMARQQGLVTIDQMIASLVYAIKNAPVTSALYTVPDIKQLNTTHFRFQPA
ncbi:NAD(P)H-binding protein [Pseudoflavitalea sp. X16]|uniref:NAD-dependent epimerase/dehydratase family protein n=1 Tax=Paraflavitalea devenefica TaxID=2716334 RepID=UPI001423FF2E|nr:NAD(P)H-binding protein [Paraflavitalea devenefica]NII25300.1 NAD(P)H-binding protein [Paraflavitalea devenefica]